MEGFGDSSKRPRPGAKRLDLTELRAAMRDERAWTALGLVWLPPGETSHYDLEPDSNGQGTDVLVHVQQMPNGEPLLCRLACAGVWRIPPIGWEVDLVIPDGELEGGAYIVGAHSPGTVPAWLDGDTLGGEAPKVRFEATAGNAEINASGHVILGGGTAPAAVASTAFETWIGQVETAINSLAPGAIAPLLAGETTHKSAKVKA
jgi:hypothetical protein